MYYIHETREMPPNRPVSPMPERSERVTDYVCRYIYGRGLSPDLALQNGWYGSMSAGDTAQRVVVPAHNRRNTPYWQARLIWDEAEGKRYQSPMISRTDSIVIVLPRFDVRGLDLVVLSEGPFDALAAADIGGVGVGLMGNNPPSIVWDHVWERYNGCKIVLVSDVDAVGATVRWQSQLAVRGLKSQVVVPCGVKDFAALPKDKRLQLLGCG